MLQKSTNKKRGFVKSLIKSLIIISVICSLAITIVINFILTPNKLTPIVREKVQEYVKSDFSIKSVSLSYLSTFPRLTLKIDSVVIPQVNDSISDLLSIERCEVAISPIALLAKRVIINKFSLIKPNINLIVRDSIKPIDTFIFERDTTTNVEDSTSSNILDDFDIILRKVKIDSSVIVIDDATREFYSKVDNLSLDMSLTLSSKISTLNSDLSIANVNLTNKGVPLLNNLSLGLKSNIKVDRDSLLLTFSKAALNINDINLKADGILRGDTLNKSLAVDIASSLKTPSLAEFINLVPQKYLDIKKEELTTSGVVDLLLNVNGVYSKSSTPIITAKLNIEDGEARFSKRKSYIENVDCDANMVVNYNNPKESYINFNNFHINSTDILDLTFNGKVSDMLESPMVDANVISKIDFNRFAEVFPLKYGVVLKGLINSNVKANFSVNDIMNSNYGRIYLDGESILSNVEFAIDGAKFYNDSTINSYLSMQMEDGKLIFGERVKENKSRTLLANMNLSGVSYRDKEGQYISMDSLSLSAGANFESKTAKTLGVGISAKASDINVGIDNQIDAVSKSSQFTITLAAKTETTRTHIKANIISDSIAATEKINNSELSLSKTKMTLNLYKNRDTTIRKWDMSGNINFNKLNIFSELFPLNIALQRSRITINNEKINLKNARLKVGNSSIKATGNISNLIRVMFIEGNKKKLLGELELTSKFIDANELVAATNNSVLYAESSSLDSLELLSTTDSTTAISSSTAAIDSTSSLPLIPKNIKFNFNLNIDSLKYGKTHITNVVGNANINNGILFLNKLDLNTIGANANATVLYNNINNNKANLFFTLDLQEMQLGRVGELMPSIDTLMPMIKSFDGIVNCNLRATTILDSKLGVDLRTLKAGISMSGKELVLMDSETFTELSKKLMFKNKKENIIDSLSVDVTIDTLKVDVLPFKVSIDRYSAIVGGDQMVNDSTYDVNYNYNISILKSPLPFKAGVDVFGDLNDYDFKITKAKLKKTDFKAQKKIYLEWLNSINYGEQRDDTLKIKN